jgi:hypothetical protein
LKTKIFPKDINPSKCDKHTGGDCVIKMRKIVSKNSKLHLQLPRDEFPAGSHVKANIELDEEEEE